MSSIQNIQIFQVDVFAERPLEGNPAGVVPNAERLSSLQMQQIARELNNSETAFLLPARDGTHDVWARFFTPTTEVPLCGHASLAAQSIFACERGLLSGTVDKTTIRQGAAGGGWTVTVSEGGCYAEMLQVPVRFMGALDARQRASLLSALGLQAAELDWRCPVEMHSTGHAKVIVALRDRFTLDRLQPRMDRLARLGEELGTEGFFVFTLDSALSGALTDCRMFAPGIGIPEDPVTGSGQGPLGSYLVRHELIPVVAGSATFLSTQGRVMGRPGLARVTVEAVGTSARRVWVGGRTRIAFEAELNLSPESTSGSISTLESISDPKTIPGLGRPRASPGSKGNESSHAQVERS